MTVLGAPAGHGPRHGHEIRRTAYPMMLEGVLVSVGLAALCRWVASRVFVRENAWPGPSPP